MLNKVSLIGRVGRDPETRSFPDGGKITNVAIATSEKWKDKNTGEIREHTEWHRVTFNGRLAEIAGEYLKKGSLAYVEGSLRTRKWTDKDQVERYATEVKADTLKLLGSKEKGDSDGGSNYPQRQANSAQNRNAPSQPQNSNSEFDDFDDDIPF